MSALKKLAGQTVVYGLSSIVGRFLNFLLVPFYTEILLVEEYGVVTHLYSFVAFVAIVLMWGMETSFFRFSSNPDYKSSNVLGNGLGFIGVSTLLFWGISFSFLGEFSTWLHYEHHTDYVLMLVLFLGFDALSAIPMANLRKKNKAMKFALINLTNIGVNIGLNFFFIVYCMQVVDGGQSNWITDQFYDPTMREGYVLLANVIASGIKLLMVLPIYRFVTIRFDFSLIKKMFRYGFPLMLAGFAGIINEVLDRQLILVLLEPVLGRKEALVQEGIYGGCYKLAVLITLVIQAFRYAAEPFFFQKAKDADSKQVYADVMKWFTVLLSLAFLTITLYLDVFKHFLGNEKYWEGLHVVPILMMANIFFGWVYNLSIWYKLTNKTYFGAVISVVGAVITIALNLWLIPILGYTGSAWATLAAYGTMAVVSYVLSQKYYRISYDLLKILGYSGLSVMLYVISMLFVEQGGTTYYVVNSALYLLFLFVLFRGEQKDFRRLLKIR